MTNETVDEPTSPDEPTDLSEVQDRIAQLLDVVGIERVVVVDDDYAPSLDQVLEVASTLDPSPVSLFQLGDIDFSEEPEIWRSQLSERFNGLGEIDQHQALNELYELVGGAPPLPGEIELLREILAPSRQFVALTPAEWTEQLDEVVATAKSVPTMVLFDRVLGASGPDGGLREVRKLFEADSERSVWAGLLTNTVEIENEATEWSDLSELVGDNAERFILLAKAHLRDGLSTLAEALRVALMSQPASRLLRAVTDSIKTHTSDAADQLHRLSPAVFERLVFGLARDEGAWEVDMLLRLFDASLRAEVRHSLHLDQDVQAMTDRVRLLDQQRVGEPIAAGTHAQSIYRRELYEDADHLCATNASLELGDIFQKTSGGKSFIVVEQPCDLMVRDTGERQPALHMVRLLPTRDTNPDAAGPSGRATFELPAFQPDGLSSWVELDRAELVPIDALDFCVLSADGSSIAPVGTSGENSWLLPNWAQRRSKIVAGCDTHRSELKSMDSAGRKLYLQAKYGYRDDCLLKPTFDGSTNFGFSLKRCGRLVGPHTRALLTRFMAHQARDAFDRELV